MRTLFKSARLAETYLLEDRWTPIEGFWCKGKQLIKLAYNPDLAMWELTEDRRSARTLGCGLSLATPLVRR